LKKNVIAILLVVALLGQTLGHAIVYFAYRANIQYIAANICENRTKVESECDGKCYLKKQLSEVDVQTTKNDKSDNGALPRVKIDKTDYFTDCVAPNTIQINHSLPISQSKSSLYTFNFSSTLFRPPSNA
jgi:hypothetical protein